MAFGFYTAHKDSPIIGGAMSGSSFIVEKNSTVKNISRSWPPQKVLLQSIKVLLQLIRCWAVVTQHLISDHRSRLSHITHNITSDIFFHSWWTTSPYGFDRDDEFDLLLFLEENHAYHLIRIIERISLEYELRKCDTHGHRIFGNCIRLLSSWFISAG